MCRHDPSRYYCGLARDVCDGTIYFPGTEEWLDCSRLCLQVYDAYKCQPNSNSEYELDISCTEVDAHSYCWRRCALTPGYDPVDDILR